MPYKFLTGVGQLLSEAWRESDRKAREKALQEQTQNKLDNAEPLYCDLLDIVHEAVRRHAADLGVLPYGDPEQYRIRDRPGVMRHSDHIRIANGRFHFAVVIRCRRLRRGESLISARDFMDRFQDALDEVTTFWGYPDVTVHSVSRVAGPNGNFWGVVLV